MNTQEKLTEKEAEPQKTYSQPKITYEMELETKAGSPLGHEEFGDPLGILEP